MTKTSLLFVSALVLSGCQKATDLGKMQEETIGFVKLRIAELDDLQRRYDELAVRRVDPKAQAHLASAKKSLDQLRQRATSVPTLVAAAAKSGHAEELVKVSDTTIEALDDGIVIARREIDAVENTVAFHDTTPKADPPPAPPSDPSTPVSNTPGAGAPATPPSASDIPCSAEIALQCPAGQVDACLKTPPAGDTHRCVPAT